MFIISYALNNLVSGIIYDTYVNYMQEMARSVATSFWAFYGYATFISALMLLLIPKTGYKKLLLFCSASCAAALLSAVFMQTESVFFLTTLLALVGIQLHYIMLAPYVAVFTDQSNNIDWYTRAYYLGYLGYFLTTYLGGVLTVKMFSLRAGVTYQAAKTLTEHVDTMAPGLREHYLQGNRDVLLLVAVLGWTDSRASYPGRAGSPRHRHIRAGSLAAAATGDAAGSAPTGCGDLSDLLGADFFWYGTVHFLLFDFPQPKSAH